MDKVRNSIHIYGITPENQLPQKINGSTVQYSDIETIFIPEDKPPVKNILQIIIQVEVTSSRVIKTPICRTMIIDGMKKVKIVYTDGTKFDNTNFIVLDIPYNTFIELPQGNFEIGRVDVFILDAYFHVVDKRKIYSYILYLVDINLSKGVIKDETKKAVENIDSHKDTNIPAAIIDEVPAPEVPNSGIYLQETISAYGDREKLEGGLPDIDAEYL